MLKYEQDIIAHAEKDAPNEACGFLVRSELSVEVEALPMPNISKDPQRNFEIDTQEFLRVKDSGRLLAVYHSHPDSVDTSKLSPEDIMQSEQCLVSYLVYGLSDKKFSIYKPKGKPVPLLGRDFAMGIYDCGTLVIDYYAQVLGYEMTYLNRDVSSLQFGFKKFREYLAENNFFEVEDRKNLREHDMILHSLNGLGTENHASVYLGDGRIMHHILRRKSDTTLYKGSYWEKTTVRVYRLNQPIEKVS